MCNWTFEVRDIFKKFFGKEGKLLLRSNFSSFPQYFLHVVRFSCLGRDQIFVRSMYDIRLPFHSVRGNYVQDFASKTIYYYWLPMGSSKFLLGYTAISVT